MKELSKYNAPLIMATCGSKGMADILILIVTSVSDTLQAP
jgi:hypothetical protein